MPINPFDDKLDAFDEQYSADTLLSHLQPRHRRVVLDGIALKDSGLISLLAGLDDLRKSYRHSMDGLDWGLSDIMICSNLITDSGLKSILEYVNRDRRVETLNLFDNHIELREHLDNITRSLNSSSISYLTLSANTRLLPAGVNRLFLELCMPNLQILGLAFCNLDSEIADAIIAYLGASRSRGLQILELEENDLGLPAVRRLIDTVESKNFTLHKLDISFGNIHPYQIADDYDETVCSSEEWADATAEYDRLTRCLERNRALSKRVSRAVRQCLPKARIILNDRSLSVRRTPALSQAGQHKRTESERGSAGFRLMDLPLDIIDLVVRHTSGDATALSDAQYARVRTEALGLGDLRATMKKAGGGRSTPDAVASEENARRQWLPDQGLDRWDCEIR